MPRQGDGFMPRLQCSPPEKQWKGPAVEGSCWDRKITVDYAIALGVTSAAFDVYLAAYPTIVLWKLQMHLKKKIALCAALGFGYWYVAEIHGE